MVRLFNRNESGKFTSHKITSLSVERLKMAFEQQYARLEDKFKRQVDWDNHELKIDSSYVHNFVPPRPVDFVLVAMEPSTGVPGKDRPNPCQIARNFSWSVEDFILHYCIRTYLCRNDESYHLTDLAKGGMKVKLADEKRQKRYERWYPLLEEEIRLLTKSKSEGTARIIAIGNVVADFLRNKDLCEHVEKVLHYARTAAPHLPKKIQPRYDEFPEFSKSVDKDAFDEMIKKVLCDGDMDSYIGYRPEGGKPYTLTESRKMLMFYYKNKFTELREDPRIVLKI